MALGPTIYKFDIALSDLNRGHYEQLNLTVAHHPSETMERTMTRVLAYCLNAEPRLEFCKGLSEADEPDLWAHTLDGQVSLWIDVGEPEPKRVKKATRIAARTLVYSFNSRSTAWWAREGAELGRLDVIVYRIDRAGVETLAALVQRTMRMSVTISEQSAYVATDDGEVEVFWEQLG